MSRLPAPDPGWRESSEGDLDRDLTEEAGSDLEDWRDEPRTAGWLAATRVVALVLVVAILAAVVGGALLGR